MSYRRAIAALVAATLATACLPPATHQPTAPPVDTTSLTISNTGFHDAMVYAYNGGQRVQIGFVPGLSTLVIAVSRHVFADGRAQLYVRLIGRPETYLTDEVTLDEGDRIVFRITQALSESTLTPLVGQRTLRP
ncbi:MAG TPA: hypothetical protein VFA43_00180 [Gemmatimonadaceae bacterium]|nr:hypothetical protein [Gemmatimonadaceae bacterium]